MFKTKRLKQNVEQPESNKNRNPEDKFRGMKRGTNEVQQEEPGRRERNKSWANAATGRADPVTGERGNGTGGEREHTTGSRKMSQTLKNNKKLN